MKCLVIALATLLACIGTSHAQNYPVKPIRIIVPYPPGGGTDIVARLIAQKVGESFGRPVIVENRAGANGLIGTEAMAKAAPDGYTLGMATPGITYKGGAQVATDVVGGQIEAMWNVLP